MNEWFPHLDAGKWGEIGTATLDTLLMLAGSLPLTLLIGVPLGVLLFLTGPRGLHEKRALYGVLALVVNLLRSVPFIILMIVLIPVTLAAMGTSLGVRGAILPLESAPRRSTHAWSRRRCARSIAASSRPVRPWVRPRARSYGACCCPRRGPA